MMELIGVIVAVALVFVLLFLRKNMALVMLIGSLVLALFMKAGPEECFSIAAAALTSASTLNKLVPRSASALPRPPSPLQAPLTSWRRSPLSASSASSCITTVPWRRRWSP